MKNRNGIIAMMLCMAMAVCSFGFVGCGDNNVTPLTPGEKAASFVDSVTDLKNEEGFHIVLNETEVTIPNSEMPSDQKGDDGIVVTVIGSIKMKITGETYIGKDAEGNAELKGFISFDASGTYDNEGETVESLKGQAGVTFVTADGKIYYEIFKKSEYPILSEEDKELWEEDETEKGIMTYAEFVETVEPLIQSVIGGLLPGDPTLPDYPTLPEYPEYPDDGINNEGEGAGGSDIGALVPMDVVEKIMPVIGTFVENEIVPFINNLVKGMSKRLEKNIAAAQQLYLTVQETEEGTVVYFDADKLKTFNQDLYTMKISAVIDKYFGDGTFAEIKESVLGVFDLTVGDILELLENNGITVSDVTGLANDVLAAVMGEGVTLEQVLGLPEGTNVEDMITDEIKATKLIDVIAMALNVETTKITEIKTTVSAAFGVLENAKFYELVAQGNQAETKEKVDEIIDLFADVVTAKLTVDGKTAAFKSFEISCRLDTDNFNYILALLTEAGVDTGIEEVTDAVLKSGYKISKGKFTSAFAFDYDAFVASFAE